MTAWSGDIGEQGVEGDTFPGGVQLGPLGHTVDVDCDRLRWEGAELGPGQLEGVSTGVGNGEPPVLQRNTGSWSRGEDREVAGHILSGRYAFRGCILNPISPTESACYETHGSHPRFMQAWLMPRPPSESRWFEIGTSF